MQCSASSLQVVYQLNQTNRPRRRHTRRRFLRRARVLQEEWYR